MIPIPESVAFYWADPTNRAAVNVLAGSTEVPPDLGWEEVEQFELACLSAQRVRVDLWRLLRSLWSVTWGTSVRPHFPSARVLPYGDHVRYGIDTVTPSVEQAWEDWATYGLYDLGNRNRLVTCVLLDESDQDVRLAFYAVDENDDWSLTEDLNLGPGWAGTIAGWEGWRATRPGLVRLNGGAGRIDAASLVAASGSAVVAVAVALG